MSLFRRMSTFAAAVEPVQNALAKLSFHRDSASFRRERAEGFDQIGS
jgi:hypothetical protein